MRGATVNSQRPAGQQIAAMSQISRPGKGKLWPGGQMWPVKLFNPAYLNLEEIILKVSK